MTKSSLALVTIVSAIPGAFLVYVLVMALLSSFGDMPTMFIALVGIALLCAAIAALLPVGVLLFGGQPGAVAAPKAAKPEKPAKAKKEKKGKKAAAVEETGATDAEMEIVDDDAEIADDELGADFDDDITEGLVTDEEIVVHTGTGQSTGELDIVEGAYTEDNLPKFEAEVSDANIQVFDSAVDEEFDGFEIPDDDEDDAPPKKKR